MDNKTERLWTIEDVGAFARVRTSIVRFWLYNTDIPYIKIGKQIRFDPEEVKGWILEHDRSPRKAKKELKRVM
jgi:hypothetical protein